MAHRATVAASRMNAATEESVIAEASSYPIRYAHQA